MRRRRSDADAKAAQQAPVPLLYVLHSGNLYGTERMAIATATRLRPDFVTTIVAPPGPALRLAASEGLATASFRGPRELIPIIRDFLRRGVAGVEPRARPKGPGRVFVATGVSHSLLFWLMSRFHLRRKAHLHLVHGGTDERLSYGRKRLLNRLGVRFVAVSAFVRERLIAHRVRAERISVIENFLAESYANALPRRGAGRPWRLERVCLISRVDPIKRIDLLFEAVDAEPALARLRFTVFGEGWDYEPLRRRAEAGYPMIDLAGFRADAVAALAESDLLLHLCPVEPFGLAILEAMTAGVPVLVPDSGGAGSLVDDGETGFRFRANDAKALARRLLAIAALPPAELERIVAGARGLLGTRFDPEARAADYRALIRAELGFGKG
jgi:glycosyltransferase involved in cell wall biosynthesis